MAFLITSVLFFVQCGGVKKNVKPIDVEELTKINPRLKAQEIKDEVTSHEEPLDQAEVANGKNIYDLNAVPAIN
ncbi:MAG: hypothetical protein IPI30_22350 [Saprospiraceae bacterium]|nr:hypothetical protein [Candidatus Vicinibacter affinis]